MVSSDNTMMNWIFTDSYERVKFTLSCTSDAGGILGWQARRDGMRKEQELYPTWRMKIADDSKYLTIYSSSKGYNPSITLYFKEYDACFAEISYLDEKKDAKSLEKALKFLKKWVSFQNPYILKNSQKNQYFQVTHTDKDTRVIRSIDQFGIESVLLGFEILPWQWINAVIEGKEYATLQDLSSALNVDFDDVKTWKQYIDIGIKNGIKAHDIHLISLGNQQKWILYTRYNEEKKMTSIDFEYIYVTATGKYAFWTWSATIPGEVKIDTSRIQDIFASLVYPGRSVLKD